MISKINKLFYTDSHQANSIKIKLNKIILLAEKLTILLTITNRSEMWFLYSKKC
jgi:hypothetical protein